MKHYKHKWLNLALQVSDGCVVLYHYTPIHKRRMWSVSGITIDSVLIPADLKFEDFVEVPDTI